MIAYVKGLLVEKTPAVAVVEAAGVGYELTIPISTYDRLPAAGSEVKLLTAHCVREDDETLYGFATAEEKTMFAKLVSVSGVGPKIAIAILSGSSISELSLAIAGGDAKRIAAIKGVGKKTAEKICVELRDKVSVLEARSAAGKPVSTFVRDAVLALDALGFGEEKASKMVSDVLAANPSVSDTETLIKLSLSGGKQR